MIKESRLSSNLSAFEQYSAKRIKWALETAKIPTTIAVYAVPALIQLNDLDLPGYQSSDEVYDVIPFFELTQEMKTALVNLDRKFLFAAEKLYERSGHHGSYNPKSLISSLMLMGSVGTVAQNDKSDFDYWVVLDKKKLTGKQLKFLTAKLKAIEQWGAKRGVELHFFLTDEEEVRENRYGSADKESAGTTQAALLKEEFYRTALHVAGKLPLWWATPTCCCNELYSECKDVIADSYRLNPTKFVDLGNVQEIPLEEFFGAALWQINKAMDSPFKSVLKMALLESFLDEHGSQRLLCEEVKSAVIGEEKRQFIDPYLVLIDRLLSFYDAIKRPRIVELVHKCFYTKVGINLQAVSLRSQTYREEVLRHYTKAWGWERATIEDMNSYSSWSFNRMSELGDSLHRFLMNTYKKLNDNLRNREHYESMISKEDLTVLGRKLISFYSSKEYKIALQRKASDTALQLESATFIPTIKRGRRARWSAARGNVLPTIARKGSIATQEVKHSGILAELVIWLIKNRMIGGGTFFHLVSSPLPVTLNEIQRLVKEALEHIPHQSISAIENRYLLHHAKVLQMMVIANFESQSWATGIEEITIYYRNSYGESFLETHNGSNGVKRAAEIYSAAIASGIEQPRKFFKIFMPKLENSTKLEAHLKSTIHTLIKK